MSRAPDAVPVPAPDALRRAGFEALALQGAELYRLAELPLPVPADRLLQELIAEVPWRQERITVCGRSWPQPRLTAWYGDPGASYRYSGLRLEPLAWSARLRDLRERVEAATGAVFNSVLLNYYRDERDSVGLHSDAEPELGPEPVIGSLSLGATRRFVLRRRRGKAASCRLPLTSGSLLLMAGSTQRHWRHGVPRERQPCGPRVNLTFRYIRSAPR